MFDIEDFNESPETDNIDEVFGFEVLSFFTLFTGINSELLYFIKLTEKDISDEKHNDLYGYVVLATEQYFKGCN